MKIALLFPGYGSQFVGMGKDLYDEYRVVQEYFEEASNCLDVNFVKLCFASSDAELGKMVNAYTALFLVGASVYAVLKESGIEPHVVAGYNNGESTALFAASCFSLPDGLYLLNKFCLFYEEFIKEMNIDVIQIKNVSTKQLENACERVSGADGKAFIAVYNSSTDHIVAGNASQIIEIRDSIEVPGSVEYLGNEFGLHSVLANQLVDQFKIYLEKVDFKNLHIPLISNIDGAIVTNGDDIKERFIRHINSPLMFNNVLHSLADCDFIILANSDKNLLKMVKDIYPEKKIVSIAKKSDIDTLKEII
jgi:[acyl-carrier-protein] S-malonyltransferase